MGWNSRNTRRNHSECAGVSIGYHFGFWIAFSACIGIFAGSDISGHGHHVSPSLMRNSFCHSNQSWKTFQYYCGTARNRNIGTWRRVKQPHPAYRNLRFFGFGVSGTCRKLHSALSASLGKAPRGAIMNFTESDTLKHHKLDPLYQTG